MPARANLLSGIRAAFPIGTTDKIAKSPLDDLFEAYVLSGVLSAAAAEGWAVSLEDLDGNSAALALFRRSPGNIYKAKAGKNFTHFVLRHASAPPLEVHIGIKATGKTGVEHECDVAVLRADDGSWCRTHRVHPKSSRLILSAECKYLAGPVPLHLGRAFVGLDSDLSSTYGQCHFVVNTTSLSVMKMLARQNRDGHEHVRPSGPGLAQFENACRAALVAFIRRERA